MRHILQRGFRNSEFPAYSFNKYANSALKETGFKNPSVSTTNLVGGYKKERVKAGRDLSLSLSLPLPPPLSPSLFSLSLFFLSFFSLRERPLRPLLAGKERENVYVNY